METNEIHRGRLIDHVHLVVRDLPASQRFYQAVFDVLGVPMGGVSDSFFWADELFVSTAASPAAQGQLTGRHHLAFQARDTAMVDAFHQAALAHGGRTMARPATGPIIPATMAPSCWTRTATISRRSSMAKPAAARPRSR